MGNSGSGAKNRHPSGDDTIPTLTTQFKSPDREPRESKAASKHKKTDTVSPSQKPSDAKPKLVPTKFKFAKHGKDDVNLEKVDVFLTGTFTDWNYKIPMARSDSEFFTIVELPVGEHQYKFLVDGRWEISEEDPKIESDIGTVNNVITVKESDFDCFKALAEDIAATKPVEKPATYGQIIPARPKPEEKRSSPPTLPPQLLQILLNKDTPANVDPTLLSEPNHVMLNHLYALSIKEGVMVLSATQRYRSKFFTTILYRPIE